MHRKKRQRKKLFACCAAVILAVIVILAMFPSALETLYAMFDESQAVHINPEEIENSTLAAGTHLIYLGALDDDIYALAVQSAKDSGQTEMYYKSELGDGAWYAISSAGSLSDITKKSSRVDNQAIKELFFTHHTRSDGITYDLRTKEAVNVFDIINPYDLDALPELEDLRNQMQSLKNSGTDITLLEDFFDTKEKEEQEDGDGVKEEKGIENPATRAFDKQMASLYEYEQRLTASGASSDKLGMVKKAMEKVDAARRYEANSILKARLDKLMNQASGSSTLSGHSKLMTAIGDCLKEVQSSMDKQDGNRLHTGKTGNADGSGGTGGNSGGGNADGNGGTGGSSGSGNADGSGGTGGNGGTNRESSDASEISNADTSALSLATQEQVRELLALVENGDDDSAGSLLDEMVSLYDIIDGVSRNPEKEKEVLDNRLIPKARQVYEETGSAAAKNELEYYEKLKALMEGASDDTRELNALYDEKQKLQEQRMAALDKNDQTEAKRLEGLIADTENQIQKLEADGIYGDGSASQSIQDIKEDTLKTIQDTIDHVNEDPDGLTTLDADRLMVNLEGISTLCGSNPDMASDALKEIYQKLQSLQIMADGTDTECEGLLTRTEEIMAENLPVIHGTINADTIAKVVEGIEGASLESKYTQDNSEGRAKEGTGEDSEENAVEGTGGNVGEGTGKNAGKGAGKSEKGSAGESAQQDSAELAAENAAVLAGLAMFCEQAEAAADSPAKALLAAKAGMLSSQTGGYVFPNLTASPGSSYAPADKVAGFCSYRYVWKDNQKKAILAQGGKYYEFRAFSDEVKQAKGEKSKMDSPALFQSVVYLPADYVEQEFSCQVYDLSGTGYSVLLDTAIADKASEVCDEILKQGG